MSLRTNPSGARGSFAAASFQDRLKRVDVALSQIREAATLVQPRRIIAAASDPDDDIFLACAAEAQSQYLVTRNFGDFPVAEWEGMQIVTARQFWGEFPGRKAQET